MHHYVKATVGATTLALAAAFTAPANAGYLNLGGSFTVNETNAPTTGSFPAVATLLPQTVDSLSLRLSEIILGGGKEWITWDFRTISGASIAGNVNANWILQAIGNTVNSFPTLTHFFLDWGINGTLISPISDVGVNLPIETNPITGSGLVFGEVLGIPNRTTTGGTGDAFTFATLITNNLGANPNLVNEFFMAEEFAAPEPASLGLLGVGLFGLGMVRRRAGRSP